MKILLVNPPWVVGGKQGVRAGSRWPHLKIPEEERYMPFPFFLAYSSSLLKTHNYKVKLIDAIAEDISYKEFKKRILKYGPNLLLSEVSTPSLEHDLKLLKELKKRTKFKLALAGPDVNLFTEKFLHDNPFVDFVFIGEYEFTLLELCQALNKKKEYRNIKGLL